MKKIKIFDEILDRPCDRAVCKRCGRIQNHRVTHCVGCGQIYGEPGKTLLDAMLTAHNRELQKDRCNSLLLSPEYIAATQVRVLRSEGYTQQDFVDYAKARFV